MLVNHFVLILIINKIKKNKLSCDNWVTVTRNLSGPGTINKDYAVPASNVSSAWIPSDPILGIYSSSNENQTVIIN